MNKKENEEFTDMSYDVLRYDNMTYICIFSVSAALFVLFVCLAHRLWFGAMVGAHWPPG